MFRNNLVIEKCFKLVPMPKPGTMVPGKIFVFECGKALEFAIPEHIFGTRITVLENLRTEIPVPAPGLTFA
jgi:hypothetical protein